MDYSCDFENFEGDQIKVALSDYDKHNVELFTDDQKILSLTFYNISLERTIKQNKFINPHLLFNICDFLAKFLMDNPNAVLTYYCDPQSDVDRSHRDFSPQEYRHNLFSKLFDYYTFSNNITEIIDDIQIIEDQNNRWKNVYIHFIYHQKHKSYIQTISNSLREK